MTIPTGAGSGALIHPERGETTMAMTTTVTNPKNAARAGDWIEVNGLPGCQPRTGQILEVLGRSGHEHFRVRWDEQHESIFFPTEGTIVIRHPRSRDTAH